MHTQTIMDSSLQTPDDDFDSPGFIVQSPTATMTQADPLHPFAFPLLASPRARRYVRPAALPTTVTPTLAPTSVPTPSATTSPAPALDQKSTPDRLRCSTGSTGLSPDYGSRGRDQGLGQHNSVRDRNLSVDMSFASRSTSRRGSLSRPVEVKETLDASVTETADGHLQLKQYMLQKIIGQGAFGIVNLGVDINTGTQYAIKEFSKSKLHKKDRTNLFKLGPGSDRRRAPAVENQSSPLDLIRGEIAILKKLNHVNIVKLYEVLDVTAEDSMFMVFELCERGVLTEVSHTDKPNNKFTDANCRDAFRQMVLGIEYLHEHDIVHRDIKPDNLLLSADGTLKIVDFGVSEMFTKKGDDLTKKSAGSPAFMAPELSRYDHGQVSGKPTDIWSMGVTLYCMRYGRLPFRCKNPLDLQVSIREDAPEDMEGEQDVRFRNLMHGLLEKDPVKRTTLDEIRNDPWLTDDGKEPLLSKEENVEKAVTEVTDDDLRGAIQRINSLVTVFKAISKFKHLLKNPLSGSSSRGPVERIGSTSSGSEDEHGGSLAPSLLASSPELKADRERLKDVDDISMLPAQAIGVISSDLLSKAESLGLEDQGKDQNNSKSQAAPTMATSSSGSMLNIPSVVTTTPELQDHEHSVNDTTDPGPAETVGKESKDQGSTHNENDQGKRYECDWQTGTCSLAKRR